MAMSGLLRSCGMRSTQMVWGSSRSFKRRCATCHHALVQLRGVSVHPRPPPPDVGLYKTKARSLGALEAATVAAHQALVKEVEDPGGPPTATGEQGAAVPKLKRGIGSLQQVPAVAPPEEHLQSALKRSSRVVGSSQIRNDADKERNRCARQMDTLMKELSKPLTRYLSSFPVPASLHPFEQALLDLTVGSATYTSTLAKIKNLRKNIQEAGKAYAGRASGAPNKKAATTLAEEGTAQLTRMWQKSCRPVSELKEIGKKLRHLPYVDPSLPTLALVGAPNVGKSSLVKILSSGLPEVCNYPFTTRSIKMGHFYVAGRPHQVTDTPGLLNREEVLRNKMELLTLATLTHLPTAVLHVMDLTEECGTSARHQYEIRAHLRERYPHKLWFDVFTKSDLLADVFAKADALTSKSDPSSTTAQFYGSPSSPVDVAASIPDALRVSSLTQEGIDRMKVAIMEGFIAQRHAVLEAQAEGEENGLGQD